MSHPPFVDVKFYPGYSYKETETRRTSASGRYIGLTKSGEVFQLLCLKDAEWEKI